MKILIICSKAFYKDIEPIKEKLEKVGHMVELPNSYYEPDAEKKSWELGKKEHSEFKARMFRMSEERIGNMDAVLTLNFDKNEQRLSFVVFRTEATNNLCSHPHFAVVKCLKFCIKFFAIVRL